MRPDKAKEDNKQNTREQPDVLEEVITRYYPEIFKYCLWHAPAPSMAEDAAQETFLKLVRYFNEKLTGKKYARGRKGKGEEGKNRARKEDFRSIRPLLYRIAANTCIDMRRKKSSQELSLESLAEYDDREGRSKELWKDAGRGHAGRAETGYERVDSDMEVLRLVEKLPEGQKEIVILRCSQDLTMREIAEIVGLPLRTVQSRLRAALKYLKNELEKEEGF